MDKGTKIGHYEIREKIGEGGMGEVYLAEDSELGRQVALKVLLSEVAKDEERVRRFVQEAKAASALNHPNILTVYQIGTFEDSRFIATELIKGETLRDRLRGDAMTLREVLDVAMQVAAALNAAHSAGIVHRDIKPENIMLRDDGFVKVLDFGLAKLVADPNATADSEDATRAQINTRPGVIMGTVQYMSPEQARGKETDARCDIWSLGVVTYEMLTKRTPFEGETANDSIAAILTKNQPPLEASTPSELQRIIKKTLQKNADERYQTVKDLLLDVKNLKREIDVSDERDLSQVLHLTDPANLSTGEMTENATAIHSRAISTQNSMAQQVSSAEYLVNGLTSHKLIVVGVSLAVLLIAGLAFGIFRYSPFGGSANKEFSIADAKISRLTTSGKATRVAISPDGKYVVHVQNDGGQQSLLMRQVATLSNVEIVPPASDPVFTQLRFSPDGNYVYYGVIGDKFPNSALFQLPTLGGEPKKILDGVNYGYISFSPNGTRFAFTRKVSPSEFQLLTANSDGTDEQKLFESKAPDFINNVAWAPDGKKIVCTTDQSTGGGTTLLEVQVADGATRRLTDKKWAGIGDMSWAADGSSLLVLATDRSGPFQLWQVSYPDGGAKQLSNEPDGFGAAFSQTPDSSTLAVIKTASNARIWVAPVGDLTAARPITTGSGKFDTSPNWLADGRIIFSSDSGGNSEIWSMTADGGHLKQIRSSPEPEFGPVISPDEKFIVFSKLRRIWRINVDGTGAMQITKGDSELEDFPTGFSLDGKWLFFTQMGANDPISWRLAMDGSSDAVRISEKSTYGGWVSPNGKHIAFSYIEKEGDPFRAAIAPIDGGEATSTFPLSATSANGLIRWTPDGRSLVYQDWSTKGVGNLFVQPISGGEPKKLTDFKSELIFDFDYSRDGKQIALSRGTDASDVLLYTSIK